MSERLNVQKSLFINYAYANFYRQPIIIIINNKRSIRLDLGNYTLWSVTDLPCRPSANIYITPVGPPSI